MAFTLQQVQQAEARQRLAAEDVSPVVRLLAGPGTGKSRSIAARVDWLLQQGVSSSNVFVISFTRATVRDLKSRIINHCTAAGTGPQSNVVHVSTMHSLALSSLRRANLLTMFATGQHAEHNQHHRGAGPRHEAQRPHPKVQISK